MTVAALRVTTGQKVHVISETSHNQVRDVGVDAIRPFDDSMWLISVFLMIFHEINSFARKYCYTAGFRHGF